MVRSEHWPLFGVQNLTAEDFPQQRIAETGSWLGLAHHGKGFGTEMRRALLHLAFEPLFGLDADGPADSAG